MQRERAMISRMVAPSRRDGAELDELVEGELFLLELADGERRPVDRQRRRDDVDAAAVGQAGVADRARFVDAAADLADDALADVHQLRIVAEADVGLLHLAVDFDVGAEGAVDHDVGDVVAGEQRLERPEAENVVADVLEQVLLLGDRHHDVLERDDVVDDVADFLARRFDIEAGELRQVDGVDQGGEHRRLDVVEILRAADAVAGSARTRRRLGSRTRRRRRGGGGAALTGSAFRGASAAGGRRRRGRRRQRRCFRASCPALAEHERSLVRRSSCRETGEQRRQGAALLATRLGTPGDGARDLLEHAGDRALGIGLGDHQAVVGGVAEQLRVERDDRGRRQVERRGEVLDLDLGTLGQPRLVDDQARRRVGGAVLRAADRRGSWRCAGWRGRARR